MRISNQKASINLNISLGIKRLMTSTSLRNEAMMYLSASAAKEYMQSLLISKQTVKTFILEDILLGSSCHPFNQSFNALDRVIEWYLQVSDTQADVVAYNVVVRAHYSLGVIPRQWLPYFRNDKICTRNLPLNTFPSIQIPKIRQPSEPLPPHRKRGMYALHHNIWLSLILCVADLLSTWNQPY